MRARGEEGQVLVLYALALLFVLVGLLAAVGVSIGFWARANVQKSADAAALAGAEAINTKTVKLGGKTLCTLRTPDAAKAQKAALNYWHDNLTQSATTLSLQGHAQNGIYIFTAKVKQHIGVLGVVGHPYIEWTVTSRATIQKSTCKNPYSGPVFSLSRGGFSHPVWNAPTASDIAPGGWPVYFIRTFTLKNSGDVNVSYRADDAASVQIDGNQVSSTAQCCPAASTTVRLHKGPHVLVVKAENVANGHQWGPNPAALTLTASAYGRTLFTSQGNPMSGGGEPASKSDWSSYTPPNPRWAVYADPMYPTSWLGSPGSLAAYFQKLGFTLKTAPQLETWMKTEIQSGQAGGSLAVMAQDVVPATVMSRDSKSALIRRYLNAGGSVLWAGDIPLYYQGLYGGGWNAWANGQKGVLGLNARGNWNYYASSQRTSAGVDYGLPLNPGPSVRAIIPTGTCPSPQALATVPGGMSAWRLDFGYAGGCQGPYGKELQKASYSVRSPGFIRVRDVRLSGANLMSDARLWGIAGAALGWWVGETPFGWYQPFSGPVFHDAYPGVPDAAWNTPHAAQNAPGGWPVSFAKTFSLKERTTLKITSWADDKILSLQVDGKALPAGGLGGPVTASVTLSAGKHLLYVKAENVANQHQGGNPAGLAVAVREGGTTLFTTSSSGWNSYSPPNPNWAVYADPAYPTSFVTRSGVQALAKYLGPVGFETKNASQLATWMSGEISSGNAGNSTLVMANDIAPDTVMGTESGKALFARYLKAGGNILWPGEVPLYFQGHDGGGTTVWGTQGLTKVLGLQNGGTFWRNGQSTLVTNAGKGYGIGQSPWQGEPSQRAMPRSSKTNCQLESLAWLNGPPSGGQHGVSYWRDPFWPTPPASCSFGTGYLHNVWAKDAPGLLRIYDFRGLDLGSSAIQTSILGVAAQMAGWYPGQDTRFGGYTPPPARNLTLSFPDGTSTAAGTPFPINFKVTDQNGALVPHQAVTFKVNGTDSGSFWASSSGALNPQDPNSLTLKTDSQGTGTAWAAFEPHTGSIKVQASIPKWSSSRTQTVQVTANTGVRVRWKPGNPNPVLIYQDVTFSGKVVDRYGFGVTPGQGYIFSWPGTWQRPYVQTGNYGTFSVAVQATYEGSSWTSLSGLSGKGPNPGPESVWPPPVSELQPYLWLGNQTNPGSELWAPWTPPNKTYSDWTFQPGLAEDHNGQALWISHQITGWWPGSPDLRCTGASAGGTCPGSLPQPGNTSPVLLPALASGRYTFAMTPTGSDVSNPQTSYLHFSIPGLTGWRMRVDHNGVTSYEWTPGNTLNLGNFQTDASGTAALSFSLEGIDNLGRVDAGYINGGRNAEGVGCSATNGGVCPPIPWVPLGPSGTPNGWTGFSSSAHFKPGTYTLTFPAGEFGDQGGQNWTQGWVNTTVTFTVQAPQAPQVYWNGAPGTYTAGGKGDVSWSFTPPTHGGYRGWSQSWDVPDTAGPEFTSTGGWLGVGGLKPGTHHVVLTFFFANGYVAKVTSPAVTVTKGPHVIDRWVFDGGANGHSLPAGWSVTPGSTIYAWSPFTWGAQNHYLSGPSFQMPSSPVTLKIVTKIPGGNWAGYSVWGMTDGTQGTRFNLGTDWADGSGNTVYGWRLGPNTGSYYPNSTGPYLGPVNTMATYSITLTPGSSKISYSVNGGPTYLVSPDAGANAIRAGDWIGFHAFATYYYSGSGFPFAVKSVTVIGK